MRKYILILLILLFFSTAANAVNYPQLRGFVTDNANMIDPAYANNIAQLAAKIEQETTVEIAVVTIESLEGESKEMYAVKLFEQAGIGKKDKNNGLLILVAKQEQEYSFEVGYGLEGIINDSLKVNIGDRIIVPNFKNGEYGKGIYEAMLVIEGLLQGNKEVISKYSMPQKTPLYVQPIVSQQQESTNWIYPGGILAIIAIGIVLLSMRRHERAPRPIPEQQIRAGTDILDAGYVLSKKASSLFNKKNYDSALETYSEALKKFMMALNSATGDATLAKSIENNIISSHRNILACKFALGIGVSEAAKSAFDEERCEDAERLYNKAVEHLEGALQDAKELEDSDEIEKMQALISETKSNINSCYIAADKIKVEELSEQAGNLIKEAVKLREDMELSKSRNNLKKAEGIIEEAFDIATKREFDEAQQILSRFLKNVREERNTVDDLQLKPIDRVKMEKRDTSKVMSSKPDIKSPTEKRLLESDDLEITRGYEVLENKDLRFGILVTNRSNYTVNDVDVHIKYDRSLFSLKGKEVISLGNITKNNPKTATYFLTLLVGCVHNSKISAIVSYRDASDNSLTVQMRPKEVHCISPFLAEKPMTEEQFSKLYESHSCHVDGIVFKGISADAITNFIVDSAKNKRYVVKNGFINGTHIIYLSSVAKDKTFYLITVIIRSKNGQTHVGLRACSNNEGGINNFINEILTSLRHYVTSDQSAREVENVINNISVQIINSEVHGGVSIGGDAFGRDESFNQGSRR